MTNPIANPKLPAMEEAEVPLEHLHEAINHSAEHGGEKWIAWVALSTALLAVFAAVAGLLAGGRANEAMMNQIESSDQWSYYQAKSIKAAILETKAAPDPEKAAKYLEEENEIKAEAQHKEAEAKLNFHQHEIFARSVTMLQIAIATAAISALTKKRRFWFVSLAFGGAGLVFLCLGFLAH